MPDNPVPLSEQIAALRRAVHERAGLAAYSGMTADPHLSALRAALATLEAQQWRPIETAPKEDDTPVLVLLPYTGEYPNRVDVGRWEPWHGLNGCFGFYWDDGPEDIQPTHWMPIPAPPEPSDA